MVRKSIFTLLSCLAFLTPDIFAQKAEPIFNLRPGDWFEMQAILSSDIPSFPKPAGFPDLSFTENHYRLRYILTGQALTGDQFYTVTLERVKLRMPFSFQTVMTDRIWVGYDSYYPPYLQEPKDSTRYRYTFKISPQGTITWPAIQKNTEIQLSQISPRKDLRMSMTFSTDPFPPDMLKLITRIIMLPYGKQKDIHWNLPGNQSLKLHVKSSRQTASQQLITAVKSTEEITIPLSRQTGVPCMMNLSPNNSILLVAASFPVPGNTVVKGRLIHFPIVGNHSIRINNKDFIVNKNGTFIASLFLESPANGHISVNNQHIENFLSPGDTLILEAKATDFKRTVKLTGKAAWDTRLAEDVKPFFQELEARFQSFGGPGIEPQDVPAIQEQALEKIEKLLKAYRGKASEECIRYFRTECMYLLAEMKLYTLYKKGYKYNSGSALPFRGFPESYFLDIDTLPVLMNDFRGNWHYNQYFTWFIPFQRARIELSGIGNRLTGKFLEKYPIAIASLKDYPLYMVLSDALMENLEKNTWTQNQRLKPYYEDYINNCRDTFFTAPLKRQWAFSEKWAPGKPDPLKELQLSDSTLFSLSQFKGKPVCLLIHYDAPGSLIKYYSLLSKPEYKNVRFIVAQAGMSHFSGKPDEKITKLENVTYVTLKSDYAYMDSMYISHFDTKAFIYDSWLKVVDGPLLMNEQTNSIFEKALTKSIYAERFSPEEKSSFIRIGIWILIAVLITAAAFILINRNTTRRLKEQEATKRKIKELEIKAIRSQMNPHFIFNALNSIQSLINAGQIKEANIYLAKFSVLLRSVLINSEKGMITLSEELEAVELYCQLEQLRFDFDFKLTVDPAVDLLTEIPGMIIQPLAENAIVHGLAAKGKDGSLIITLIKENDKLVVTVADNGSGFPKETMDKLSEKGFGLKLVEERMKILSNKQQKASLKFQATNTNIKDGGTTAILIFPTA